MLAGTDLVGSPSNVAAEAVRLGDFGLTNQQVVQAVSHAGFEATGRSAEFAVGSPANAVLFPVDPCRELGVLAHPAVIIREGALI